MNSTKAKGNLTELAVMMKAIELGIVVSVPYGDCDKYDQIWDIGNKLLKVQVKTARQAGMYNNFTFNCYSVANGKKHKYTKQDIDYFATIYDNKVYLIPVEHCSLEKTLWLSIPKELESQKQKFALAENYKIEKIIN